MKGLSALERLRNGLATVERRGGELTGKEGRACLEGTESYRRLSRLEGVAIRTSGNHFMQGWKLTGRAVAR